MRIHKYALLLLNASAPLIAACNQQQCNNTNPYFAVQSIEYKKALNERLSNADSKVTGYIGPYTTKNGKKYMAVSVNGADYCASAHLEITGNKELEEYRKVKGISYEGAELADLKYHIDSTNGRIQLCIRRYNSAGSLGKTKALPYVKPADIHLQ